MHRAVVVCLLLLSPLGARAELVEYQATFEIVSPTLELIDGYEAVAAAGITELVTSPSVVQLPDFRPEWSNNHPLLPELWFPFDGPTVPPLGFANIDFTVGHLTLITGTAALADPVLPVPGTAFYNLSGAPFGPMTQNGGMTGVGIGGPAFLPNTTNTAQFFSLRGAPWTVHNATVTSRRGTGTPGPVSASFVSVGFAHGPLSSTASALAPGGALRVVTPIQMSVQTNFSSPIFLFTGFFGRLEVRVIPEPSAALGLVGGAILLLWLGRRRARGRVL
jgi:hypothetical protein